MQNLKLLAATLIATIVLIAAAAWLFSGDTQKINEQAQGEVSEAELVPEGAHVRGATQSARFTIVEFSDLQCPACRTVQPYVKALVDQYPADVRLVYRHFPLLSIHPHAYLAAQAVESASIQGKFWEMHDVLFETQPEWSKLGDPREYFADLAKRLELDTEKFAADFDSEQAKKVVDRDLQFATQYQLSGTPSFFLNGRRANFEDIRSQIQSELGQ